MILDIKGRIIKSHLEIPEGFYIITSGKFLLKGSQFPYTLGGNFEALSGHVERNLSATASLSEEETNTYSNQYLPEVLQSQYLDPIYLDLNVNVSRGLPVKFSMPIFEVNTPHYRKSACSRRPQQPYSYR